MDTAGIISVIGKTLDLLGIEYEAIEEHPSKNDAVRINILTRQSGRLIGTRGETLSALNLIVKKMVSSANESTHISVDVNGYLEAVDQAIRNKTYILAERAKSFKTDVEMEPMSAYDRMVAHSFLKDDPHLETVSIGAGKNRRIVIKYKE